MSKEEEFKKPKVSSDYSQRQLDKAEEDFKKYDENIKELTLDRMNAAPKLETENQTKLSQKEIENSKELYLKPKRRISSKEVFNEKYRKDWEFDKEYVCFIAENKEIIGETIDAWTKPYAGVPAEEWDIPVNTPVWGPRYLAEQIKRCTYHRLKTQDRVIGGDGGMQYYGGMVVDNVVQRLDAYPANTRKTLFMGNSF